MWWGEKLARQPRSRASELQQRACVDWCSNASRRISGLRPMSGSTWASRAHCGPEEHSVVVTLRWPVRSAAATTTRADRMRPPVSRAAFASVLMGPRALGASLVAARCASSSPVAAAAAAVTAYGEATTIRDSFVHVDRKARLSPPPHI
jgi:hypothetical protein